MTLREKKMILFFLEEAKLDQKNAFFEEAIFKKISNLSTELPEELKKELFEIESDLIEHLFNIKFSYLSYGADAGSCLF